MTRVAMRIGRRGVVAKIPKGTVLVAVKRFDTWRGGLTGPYSNKRYRTPVGKWSPARKRLKVCVRGWHVTTASGLSYFSGAAVYIVECRGAALWGDNKAAVGQIRLVRVVTRDGYLFNSPGDKRRARRALRAYIRKANRAVVARG